eukprot:Selendium_serpulae@DN2808_c0_g1_i1.p1
MGLFFEFGYRDGYVKLSSAYLLQQILQEAVVNCCEAVAELVNVPDTIQTDLSVAVYESHFQTAAQTVSLLATDVASMLVLLKENLTQLALSAFDPVACIVNKIAQGGAEILSAAVLQQIGTGCGSMWLNFRILHRFLLTEKNMVFDTDTRVPVPQRLALRQRAAAKDSMVVVSVISRYVPPDARDPRLGIESALRVAPEASAGKLRSRTFLQLAEELLVIREVFSSMHPPQYEKAAVVADGLRRAMELDEAQFSAASTMRWIVEHLKRRMHHALYLKAIQEGEYAIKQAQDEHSYAFERRKADIAAVCDFVKRPSVSHAISRYAGALGKSLKLDAVGQAIGREAANPSAVGLATASISHEELFSRRVLAATSFPAQLLSRAMFSFTALPTRGWRIQLISRSEDGIEKTVGEDEIDEDRIEAMRWLPGGSKQTFLDGKVEFYSANLLYLFKIIAAEKI